MPVSKKDQLRVNLGVKRVERIKAQALIPWQAKKPVGTTIYDASQVKGEYVYRGKVINPDLLRNGKDVIHAVAGMRTSESKLTIVRRSDNFSDYADESVISEPKPVLPRVVTPRADSPFKRAKMATVIVRK